MEARSLQRLMQWPRAARLGLIADGLPLLVEHIERLGAGLVALSSADELRAGAVLEAVAEEEAAKVFVLLDLVRLGFDDDTKASAQIANFYSHLARSIYGEVIEMSPATFWRGSRSGRGTPEVALPGRAVRLRLNLSQRTSRPPRADDLRRLRS